MPYYSWQAIDWRGTMHSGLTLARSPKELEQALIAEDLGLVHAVQKTPKNLLKPITSTLKYDFYKQLSLLLAAGLSVDKALVLVAVQSNNSALRAIVEDIVADVQDGYSLAHGLSHYQGVFSPLVQQVIASTHDIRSLSLALDYLAEYEQGMHQFTQKIKSSLMMPVITLLFFIGVAGIIIGFIVPRFAQLFASFDRQVPAITRILMAISEWVSAYGLFVVPGLAILSAALCYYAKHHAGARRAMKNILFKLPFIGALFRDMSLTFYFKSLALLVHNGGNVRQALSYAQWGLRASSMQEKTSEIIAMVDEGHPLYKAFALHKELFSPEVISLLAVGQESGTMFFVFSRICDIYRARLDSRLALLTQGVQPIFMIVLGGLIMGLIVAVYMPIFTMSSML